MVRQKQFCPILAAIILVVSSIVLVIAEEFGVVYIKKAHDTFAEVFEKSEVFSKEVAVFKITSMLRIAVFSAYTFVSLMTLIAFISSEKDRKWMKRTRNGGCPYGISMCIITLITSLCVFFFVFVLTAAVIELPNTISSVTMSICKERHTDAEQQSNDPSNPLISTRWAQARTNYVNCIDLDLIGSNSEDFCNGNQKRTELCDNMKMVLICGWLCVLSLVMANVGFFLGLSSFTRYYTHRRGRSTFQEQAEPEVVYQSQAELEKVLKKDLEGEAGQTPPDLLAGQLGEGLNTPTVITTDL